MKPLWSISAAARVESQPTVRPAVRHIGHRKRMSKRTQSALNNPHCGRQRIWADRKQNLLQFRFGKSGKLSDSKAMGLRPNRVRIREYGTAPTLETRTPRNTRKARKSKCYVSLAAGTLGKSRLAVTSIVNSCTVTISDDFAYYKKLFFRKELFVVPLPAALSAVSEDLRPLLHLIGRQSENQIMPPPDQRSAPWRSYRTWCPGPRPWPPPASPPRRCPGR